MTTHTLSVILSASRRDRPTNAASLVDTHGLPVARFSCGTTPFSSSGGGESNIVHCHGAKMYGRNPPPPLSPGHLPISYRWLSSHAVSDIGKPCSTLKRAVRAVSSGVRRHCPPRIYPRSEHAQEP